MPRSKTPKQIPQQERHGGLRRTDSFVPAQGPGYMAYAEVDFNAWIRRCHPSGDHAGQLVGQLLPAAVDKITKITEQLHGTRARHYPHHTEKLSQIHSLKYYLRPRRISFAPCQS